MRRAAMLVAALAVLGEAGAEGRQYDYLFEPGAVPLAEVVGMQVVTPEGRRLGRISDLVVDRGTGRIEEVAAGGRRYPIESFLSGEAPGEVVLDTFFPSSAGASALLPVSPPRALTGASRLGAPEALGIDLREGRIQRAP